MTCIVGLEHGGKVWMGGDSAGVHLPTLSLVIRGDPKVFQKSEMLFGFTSSFRMGQLLQHSLVIPPHLEGRDVHAYLCSDFIDAVRQCFQVGGFLSRTESGESGGIFLIGYQKKAFTVYKNFQVSTVACGYNACGSGRDLALGSLHSTADLVEDPERRVRMALEAAAHFSAGVAPPFTILSM